MKLTPKQLKEMDDKVREIGKFLDMEFDKEGASKRKRGWNYWAELKNGKKTRSFHTSDFELQGRWEIRAEFPRDNKRQLQTIYGDHQPEITVSMNKSAEKIARDIKSRLLPEYESQLVEVLARIESSNKYEAGKLATKKKIVDFLGVSIHEANGCLYPDGQRGVYKIEANSEKTVKFDVEVGADKAIEILKILGY